MNWAATSKYGGFVAMPEPQPGGAGRGIVPAGRIMLSPPGSGFRVG